MPTKQKYVSFYLVKTKASYFQHWWSTIAQSTKLHTRLGITSHVDVGVVTVQTGQ